MGKHHRQSKFIRNAAVAGATIAGVTALAAPAGSQVARHSPPPLASIRSR